MRVAMEVLFGFNGEVAEHGLFCFKEGCCEKPGIDGWMDVVCVYLPINDGLYVTAYLPACKVHKPELEAMIAKLRPKKEPEPEEIMADLNYRYEDARDIAAELKATRKEE